MCACCPGSQVEPIRGSGGWRIGLQDNWMGLEGQAVATVMSALVPGHDYKGTHVHVDLSGKKFSTRWVQQQHSLEQF